MSIRKYLGKVLLVILLISIALPVTPAHAQDQPGDQATLLAKVLAAIEVVDTYKSYAVSTEQTWYQSWTGGLTDEIMEGQTVEMIRREQGTAVLDGTGANIQHLVTVSSTQTPLTAPPTTYSLEGEIRVVDGAVYVNATYEDARSGLPTLPDGWAKVSDINAFQVWPGLGILMNPQAYFGDEASKTSYRLLGIRVTDLAPILDQYVTNVTSAPAQLEDGSPVEVISVTLNREGVRAAGIAYSPNDPVEQLIYENTTGDPLTITFSLDDQGYLIEQNLLFEVKITDLDISAAVGAPPGYIIDLTLRQAYNLRFTAINEPVARVEAPDIQAAAALPAFAIPAPAGEQPWWNDRVFYEVFVRSFYDSDGDGTGDLRGLIEKLDYLNDGDPATTADLGITGIWLMPVAQSPSYHGYDVSDYYAIEADYGTNQDFLALVQAAHERGIAVIVDLVMNHTSSEHPWFVASRAGDPEYDDWYIWTDDPPDYRGPWGQQVWYPAGDRFYFALFWSGMPDLNYSTPEVTTQMYDIIRFWLSDMGVDGFRLDAIRHLDEDGPVMQNTPETLAWLDDFHAYVRTISETALMVGEVWDTSSAVAPYIEDKVDIAFEFDFATAILTAAQLGHNQPLIITLNTLLELYPPGQYATFLTNHDQNRVMSQLQEDEGAARVAATILLTSPGVPFIYYGEEVGMVGAKPDERIRTPMQWDDSLATAGFSTVMPWQRVQDYYKTNNVAVMTDDPGSLLNHYRTLVHLRDEHPALRTGTIQLVESSESGVYSFLRYGEDETLLIVVNLSKNVISDYTLTAHESLLSGTPGAELLFGAGEVTAPTLDDAGGFTDYGPLAELPPQSSFIIRLQ
jgi:alpha-amylase